MESSEIVFRDWKRRENQVLRRYPLFVLAYWILLVAIFYILPLLEGILGSNSYILGILMLSPFLLITLSTNIVWSHEAFGTAANSSNFRAKRVLQGALSLGILGAMIASIGLGILPLTPSSMYSIRLYILGFLSFAVVLIPVFLTTALLSDNPARFLKDCVKPPLSWLVYPCIWLIYAVLQLYGFFFSIMHPMLSVVWVIPIALLLPIQVMILPYFAAQSRYQNKLVC